MPVIEVRRACCAVVLVPSRRLASVLGCLAISMKQPARASARGLRSPSSSPCWELEHDIVTETVGMSKVLASIMRDFFSVWATNVEGHIDHTTPGGRRAGVMILQEMSYKMAYSTNTVFRAEPSLFRRIENILRVNRRT